MRALLLAIVSLIFSFQLQAAEQQDPTAQKEWTFLLFLNGHNNLDSFGSLNLNQMEKVGSSDQVNLVVQWASSASSRATKRLLIRKDTDTRTVTSPILQDMGRVDMGDYRELRKFILWGMDQFPAKHYFVAVWDHGSGWHEFTSAGLVKPNGISWDDFSHKFISTPELGLVMQEVKQATGRKIDIYGSDACLMQMVEIAGEMKGAVDYFVGSQELEPGAGWPYDQFLAPLVSNPTMSPRDLSKVLVDKYAAAYTRRITLSSLDMSRYESFAAAMGRLASAISAMPSSALAKVKAVAVAAMAFDNDDYGDAGDFFTLLNAAALPLNDIAAIPDARAAYSNFVVHSRVSGDYGRASGMSLWLPKDKATYTTNQAQYENLQFNRATNWSRALRDYLN